MELQELLDSEGLGPDEMAETLAWARERAEELVAGLVADGELGPLLDADFEGSPLPQRESSDESFASPDDEARAVSAATADALAELPAPPDGPELPEVAAGVEGSVATSLPEADQGHSAEVVQATHGLGIEPAGDEITQPRALNEAMAGVTNSGSIEIDDEEIELLDDDDLELVDDDDAGVDGPTAAPPAMPGPAASQQDVPEWQAALNSASMGGGAQADQDSGLYRIGAGKVEQVQPASESEEPVAPSAPEHDESMDIDLGDI